MSDGLLREQLTELREVAAEVLREVAEALHGAIGDADAVDLLSQWEGFGRFCRESLAVEPLTLITAFGLGEGDPAKAVREAYPDVKLDEGKAVAWADLWVRSWTPRFGGPR